jgi:hypothetical protein
MLEGPIRHSLDRFNSRFEMAKIPSGSNAIVHFWWRRLKTEFPITECGLRGRKRRVLANIDRRISPPVEQTQSLFEVLLSRKARTQACG